VRNIRDNSSTRWSILREGNEPVLEKAYDVHHKKLFLTSSAEGAINSHDTEMSGRTWTLWLSSRDPVDRSVNELVLKIVRRIETGSGV